MPDKNSVSQAVQPADSAGRALLEATRVNQLRTPAQPAKHLSAMDDQSGGHGHRRTDARPDAAAAISAEDQPAIVQHASRNGKTATPAAEDYQSEPVVRALLEPDSLNAKGENEMSADDEGAPPAAVVRSNDRAATSTSTPNRVDPTTEIVVPLAAPSEDQSEQLTAVRGDDEITLGTNEVDRPLAELPEGEITVSVIGEPPLESIRMLKRVR